MPTSKNAESAFFSVSEKNDFDLKRKIISKSLGEKMTTSKNAESADFPRNAESANLFENQENHKISLVYPAST
jgi:hypothetical protein